MKRSAIIYSETEFAWIKANCTRSRREAHEEFCAIFHRDNVSLINFNALCKRKGWLTGRNGHFKSGHVPDNKGKKMPFNPNSARTQFKRGRQPHNTKFEGHERVSKDGYVEISIAETNPHTGFDRRYVLKHRWLWEKANGPVPDGMCLKCLDGDRQNTEPSNWAVISRGALPRLSGRWGLGYDEAEPEVRPGLLATARLKQVVRELKK